jgi:DNA-binding NarL/FixJ family response regulator
VQTGRTEQPRAKVPTRVLIVDDFRPFLILVRSLLEAMPDLRIVGEASDGLEAIQKAEELDPDLILLDVGLPKLSGIEAARRIRQLVPRSKILFLSQESDPDVVQEALGLGVGGYILKMQAGNELLVAIKAVLRGEQFVSNGLTGHDSPTE